MKSPNDKLLGHIVKVKWMDASMITNSVAPPRWETEAFFRESVGECIYVGKVNGVCFIVLRQGRSLNEGSFFKHHPVDQYFMIPVNFISGVEIIKKEICFPRSRKKGTANG